jgi:hypothetical protein
MGARSALAFLFRRICRIYFREIEVAGERPSPGTRGRLFAANHVNGLVDPILVLTQAPCTISPIAKSTLWKIPGLRWLLDIAEAVPIVRRKDVPGKSVTENEAVFVRIATHLANGGNILIFPEGVSHSEPRLVPLRSGAGRMLSRAYAEPTQYGPPHELTFQAVALEFDQRDIFRSRALVLFGPVRRVAEMKGADLATAITEALARDLSELLVEADTWEQRRVLVRVAEMFAEDADDTSLAHLNRLGRRIGQARRVLASSAPNDVRSIEERVRAYMARLEQEEISDDVVARIARGTDAGLELARVARAAAMIVTLPLAIAATVIYWFPYQLPRFITRKLKGDPDLASTYKLGIGLVVFPVWALATTTLAFVELPSSNLAWLVALVVVVSPFAALSWLDQWDRRAARASLLVPLEQRRERLEALAIERTTLMRDLDKLRERAET